jgi:hypothetical protein
MPEKKFIFIFKFWGFGVLGIEKGRQDYSAQDL